ncbi:MAG TPA: hypothetical protein VG826_24365 [Pirellulales bacterium]|nr:hypothetical protein [Pirellulales bacterium]
MAVSDRAVDMIALVSGERLMGMFAGPVADGSVTFYVARDWLEKHQPALYRKVAAGEEDRRKQALQKYLERLSEWRDRRAEPRLLNNFIERSIRDVEARLNSLDSPDAKSQPSQLLIVEFPAARVRRHFTQPQRVRRLLGLAWEANLANVEDLSAQAIAEELKKQGVDIEYATPDLSDRFEIVSPDDRQWAAKVALIEFEILGKPRFQGTGGVLLRDDGDGARPPLADLVSGLIQDQLGDALGDLLNPQPGAGAPTGAARRQAAVDKALASARDDKATGVRITYLDQSLQKRQVSVTDTFYARMPDERWQAIWQQSAVIALDGAKDLNEDQLAADPQIAEIPKTLQGLGLDANNDLFKSALRFGGATQKALQATNRDFAEFILAQTRRLIGPPVAVPTADR